MRIRRLENHDRSWAAELVAEHFGNRMIASRGKLYDTHLLPGLVAQVGSDRLGLVHYRIEGEECEVVVLITTIPRQGVGRTLLDAVKHFTPVGGRLWLVTSNENLDALAFYPAVGWQLVAVHAGAMAEARRLKPAIPLISSNGLPIEDEIEFEWRP